MIAGSPLAPRWVAAAHASAENPSAPELPCAADAGANNLTNIDQPLCFHFVHGCLDLKMHRN